MQQSPLQQMVSLLTLTPILIILFTHKIKLKKPTNLLLKSALLNTVVNTKFLYFPQHLWSLEQHQHCLQHSALFANIEIDRGEHKSGGSNILTESRRENIDDWSRNLHE